MIKDDLKSKINKCKVISFDVFDTLIKRCVDKPSNLFFLVEKQYISKYGNFDVIDGFGTKRIAAEHAARKMAVDNEITLENIYHVLEETYDNSIIERYKLLELKAELELCVANPGIKEAFNYCKSSNKKILIITDMYLPLDIIVQMLEKTGYTGYSRIYLSCEIKKTKMKGDLFRYVLNNELIDASEMLHIGDNIKSDIRNASQLNINTYHVKDKLLKIKGDLLLENACSEVLDNFLANTMSERFGLFHKVGYACFGPMLFGFIQWIKESTKEKGIEKIFFLSRDGFIMKEVYELIKDATSVPCEYMYASRRALQGAAIHLNPSFENVMSSMFFPRKVTTSWILKRWGLNPDECKAELDSTSVTIEYSVDGNLVLDDEKIKKLYYSLQNRIIEKSKQEFEAFITYLKELDFSGKIAIVDIGWYGNMQNSLITMLENVDNEIDVTGYYLGIVPESKYQIQYKMNGYLFQAKKNENLFYSFKYLNSLMELFFMAPHGSCKRYSKENDGMFVELDSFEFDGTYTYDCIIKVQESAVEFVKAFSIKVDYVEASELVYLNHLYSTFMRPSIEIADKFGELAIWDDKWIKIAPKTTSMNVRKLKAEFLNTPWKIGYLKRLIKLPLDYQRVVESLRKIYKK